MQDKASPSILRVIRRSRSWRRVVFDVVRRPSGFIACQMIDDHQTVLEVVGVAGGGGEAAGRARPAPPRPWACLYYNKWTWA
jgi:hypothetical protein